jgi:hypothetical protein
MKHKPCRSKSQTYVIPEDGRDEFSSNFFQHPIQTAAFMGLLRIPSDNEESSHIQTLTRADEPRTQESNTSLSPIDQSLFAIDQSLVAIDKTFQEIDNSLLQLSNWIYNF